MATTSPSGNRAPVAWSTADILALSFVHGMTSSVMLDIIDDATMLDDIVHHGLDGIHGSVAELRLLAEQQLDMCARHAVRVVSWWDDDYPDRLRSIIHPPALLYVRGEFPSETRTSIAVVGTRSCSMHYGKPITSMLVKTWCERGGQIISGLALGVDTLAHEACLKVNGYTAAVIASGHDCISPSEARKLSDSIVNNGGAVVTEYRCGVKALPPYFPARNRIISGLADTVVVVESKATGGALITADFALRDGRKLYAVPGAITSTRSAGTNNLIRLGKAQLLASADDVLEAPPLQMVMLDRVNSLSVLDQQILQHLGTRSLSAAELAAACNCTVVAILGRILELELMGYVSVIPGQRYVLSA